MNVTAEYNLETSIGGETINLLSVYFSFIGIREIEKIEQETSTQNIKEL